MVAGQNVVLMCGELPGVLAKGKGARAHGNLHDRPNCIWTPATRHQVLRSATDLARVLPLTSPIRVNSHEPR